MKFISDNAVKFQTGESTTIKQGSSPIPKQTSADVVFVVEQKNTCSNSMYTDNLKELPTMIDKSLQEKQVPITNNRFAVVGYGSGNDRTGPKPHIFTIASSIFSTSSNVPMAFNRYILQHENFTALFHFISLSDKYIGIH